MTAPRIYGRGSVSHGWLNGKLTPVGEMVRVAEVAMLPRHAEKIRALYEPKKPKAKKRKGRGKR